MTTIQSGFSFQQKTLTFEDQALNEHAIKCSDSITEKGLMLIPLVGTAFAIVSIIQNMKHVIKLENLTTKETGLKSIICECYHAKIARAFLCLIPFLGTIAYGLVLLGAWIKP